MEDANGGKVANEDQTELLDSLKELCDDPKVFDDIRTVVTNTSSSIAEDIVLEIMSSKELSWEVVDVFGQFLMHSFFNYEMFVNSSENKIVFLQSCNKHQRFMLLGASELCAWLLREASDTSLSHSDLRKTASSDMKVLLASRTQDHSLQTGLAAYRQKAKALEVAKSKRSAQIRYYDASFRKYPFVDPLQSKNANLYLVARLSRYIQHVAKKENKYYSRYIPLLQSTGYGKSRLVFELAKSTEPVVVVPICLRATEATGESRRTEPIVSTIEDSTMTELQWATFFAALVEEVAIRVKEQPALKTDVSLRQSWYGALCGVEPEAALSSSFLVAASSSSSSSIGGLDVDYGTVFWNAVQNRWTQKQTTAAKTFSAATGSWSDCLSTTEEPSTKQEDPTKILPGDYTIVVALDECASTFHDGKSITAMAQTLSRMKTLDCTLVCLLLDTSSRVANFAPEYKLYPSSRVASGGRELYELYVLFYAFPQRLFRGEEYLAHEAIRTYRTSSLLRCRTISDVHEGRQRGDSIASILHDIVRSKLQDSKRLAATHKTDLYHFSLAALRWQLMTISQADQADLLHMHLAVLYGLAPQNARIYCGYPLEPALVRAAATVMAQDLEAMQRSVLTAVQKRQMESMLVTNDGKGEAGEMVALMLLCFAHDRALQDAPQGMSSVRRPTVYRPITFLSLMEQLYPSETFTSMLNDLVALYQYQPEVLQQLQTALVYFTGGRKLEVEVTMEHLRAALKEGMVLMAKQGVKGMDAYIPLVLPKCGAGTEQTIVDLDDPSTYDLSCVCVQIKNTKKAGAAASLVRNMRQTNFANSLYDLHPPLVLYLVMQLGDVNVSEGTKKGGLIKSEDMPLATSTSSSSSSAASTPSTIGMEMRLMEGPPCIGGRTSRRCSMLRDMVSFSDKDYRLKEHLIRLTVKDAQSAMESYKDVWFYERTFRHIPKEKTVPSKPDQSKAPEEEEEEEETEEEPYDAGEAKVISGRKRSHHLEEEKASERSVRQKRSPARGGPKR